MQSGCPGLKEELEVGARPNAAAAWQDPIENLTVRRRTRSGQESFSFATVTVVAFGPGALLELQEQRTFKSWS